MIPKRIIVKITENKYVFFHKSIMYLGHVMNSNILQKVSAKIKAIVSNQVTENEWILAGKGDIESLGMLHFSPVL